METKNDAYQVITDRIVELLEQGTVPWHKPWQGGGEAKNLVSKRPYRGINRFLLNMASYASPFWLTFNQAQKLGGHVKKGEKSTPVVFWKWLEKENPETGEVERRPCLRYYRVFNLEQTEGLEHPASEEAEPTIFTPIERCEQLLAGMKDKPFIQHEQQAAWYSPSRDLINLPKPESFESPEEFYSTLYHEAGHWTGAKHRLNRPTLTDMAPFGSTNYSKEELVAEMTAAMLCAVTGIENKTIDNSAAYLQGWLDRLKKDRRLVVTAAAQAQRAADYVQFGRTGILAPAEPEASMESEETAAAAA